MNIERRVIGFIYYCFSFPSSIKAGGSMKYKCDSAYKRVMSSVVGREESAVYDLIYRHLIYKRGSLISSASQFQKNINFEDVCYYRFVGRNMLWQLVPINKKMTHLDLKAPVLTWNVLTFLFRSGYLTQLARWSTQQIYIVRLSRKRTLTGIYKQSCHTLPKC